jgi:hypothetical protein
MEGAASAPILAIRAEMAQARAVNEGSSAQWLFRRPWSVPNLITMNDSPKDAEKMRQQRRLSAALRENLKRRKAQAKSRAAPSRPTGVQSHDSAGIAGKNNQEH